MVHTRRAEKTLQGLHRDGEAECQEENTIDESGKDLCPVPAIRVPRITRALGGQLGAEGYVRRVGMKCHKFMTNPDSIESYDQAHDIAAGG